MKNAVRFSEVLKNKQATDGKYELSLAEFVRPFAAHGEEITVSGKGSSMLPTISEQCSLIMAPLPKGGVRAGDILLYERPNGQPVIHRVWRVTKDGYDMLGDNQFEIERKVSKDAAVACVKTILYPNGTRKAGRMKAARMYLRYARRRLRRLAGRVYRKIFPPK